MTTAMDQFERYVEIMGIESLTEKMKPAVAKLKKIIVSSGLRAVVDGCEPRIQIPYNGSQEVKCDITLTLSRSAVTELTHPCSIQCELIVWMPITIAWDNCWQIITKVNPRDSEYHFMQNYDCCPKCQSSTCGRVVIQSYRTCTVSVLCPRCSYCVCGGTHVYENSICTQYLEVYMFMRLRLRVPKDVARIIILGTI